VQVLDLGGHFHSFDMDEVASVKHDNKSLMPDNYGRVFTARELDDLVSYLSTLRGEATK
jgi:hypothetical protein